MNISEAISWVDFIYQIAREDKVEGGTGGVANLQAKQLADRTQFLRMLIESMSDYREYTFIKTEADPDGTIAGLNSTPAGKMFRVAQSGAEILSFRYYLNNSGVAEEVTGLLGRGSITNNIRMFDSLSLAEEDLSVGNILPGARLYIRSAENSAIADEYINNTGTLEKTGEYIPSKDGVVKPTDKYRDGVTAYVWGKVMENGYALPGTLQGMDGLPADENVAAYAAKGVAVYQLNPADIPAGHSIVKDGIVLASWDQRGHIAYLPPFNMQAQASVMTSPVMTPTQLPESVRAAIEPCAKLACKYTLNQQFPLIVPLAGGSGLPSSITTMTVLESYYVYLAAAAAWIAWVDTGNATWDAAGIGVSYDNAVAWTSQGVELIAAAHVANGGSWGGPMPPWSDDTESVALTFASQAAEAARNISNYADLIWSHLTDDGREKIKAMVSHEATRFVTYAPKYMFSLPNRYGAVVTNYPGDSKSEELAWNLGILARALVLDPDNENAERWAERMVTMQIAALGDRNDLSDPMPLNGLAPRDTLRGTNVNPTRLVENHNVADGQDISRWYSMAALSGSEWMIRTFFRANQPIPAVALWHMKDTIRAVEYMPDGSLWDMDWREPVGELSYAPLIAYMFADPNADYVTQFLHRASIFAGQQDPETGALPDGSFNWPVYGSSQPGEILQMIMLSARMNDPLTAPHSTNAHYTHLAAIYRSV
ncbi:TPA: hypothetical protein U6M17_001360 [Klebsiella pneumoniae]|uniref:hypothetical protein n=1 Tax=Klebsiella pneumoniae TaxID=573 RepID=UPI000E2E0951|nr:hypothetical protein [Klebsiella pneumoniae]UZW72122.1 hypothetical protein LCN95_09460 [Klebsiella pneumoniae]SYG61016.1 Uncharacterised protein [Klebsiella pneumoniae]HEO0780182.1 hypothetical protein [Klebsiella pneumoniae]